MSATKEKHQAMELAMSQIERQFGKGAIMRLGSDATIIDVPVIPTGSLSLDVALGLGGVPRGRVVEIFGPESSGKTTLALHIVAEAQWSLTRWPPWCPAPKSKGKWATPTWGCRLASCLKRYAN
ncbi:MAG: hypothetical protein P8X67_17630 [Syntrophobacterales bacterium]